MALIGPEIDRVYTTIFTFASSVGQYVQHRIRTRLLEVESCVYKRRACTPRDTGHPLAHFHAMYSFLADDNLCLIYFVFTVQFPFQFVIDISGQTSNVWHKF